MHIKSTVIVNPYFNRFVAADNFGNRGSTSQQLCFALRFDDRMEAEAFLRDNEDYKGWLLLDLETDIRGE